MGWGGLGGRKCGLVWFGFGHRFSRLEMGSIHGFLLDGRMGTTQNGCRASSIPNSSSPRQPSQHHIHKSLDAPPLCLPMLSSLPWLAGETFPSIARAVLADAFLAAVAHRRDAQSRASTCDGEVRAMACARGGGRGRRRSSCTSGATSGHCRTDSPATAAAFCSASSASAGCCCRR